MGNHSSIKRVKMKFLVTMGLVAVASAAQYKTYVENQPTSFRMVEDRSANGSPRVEVTFSDGYTDTMVLNKHYATEEDRMAGTEDCNYIGHLANEKDACVAMTGCIGSEDVEFTIMSTHATESPMFKWTREGRVEVIESQFKEVWSKIGMMWRTQKSTVLKRQLNKCVPEELTVQVFQPPIFSRLGLVMVMDFWL